MEPMNNYNCSLCDIQCNSVVNLEQHYKSSGHQHKMKQSRLNLPVDAVDATPPVSGDEGANVESTDNGSSGFNVTPEELDYCSICDLTFNHPTPARQHYQGAKHLQKKQKLQQPQEAKGIHGDCKLCNKVFLGQMQAEAHFSSKKHLEKVEAANKPPAEHENFGECTLCNKIFPFENQAKSHYESKKHLEKVKAAENPVEKKEPFGECTLCAKVFPFETQAKTHYESKKHLQKVRAKEIEEGKINPDAEGDVADGKQPSPLFGKCELCSKVFPSEVQANSHYNSKKHIQKAELLKLRVADQEADDAADGKVEIPPVKPFSGTAAELQAMDLPAIHKLVSTTMSCPFCRKTFSGYQPVKDHLSSKKHIARVNMVKLNPELSGCGPASGTTNALGSVCEDISVDECGPSEEQMVFGEILDECILDDIVNALLKEMGHNPQKKAAPIKEEKEATQNDDQSKSRKRSLPANEEPPVVPVRQSKRRNCK